jgi:3-methylcrotonyl-CoA carboxylase alpha subunit
VIRTCRQLGIRTVAVYSDADSRTCRNMCGSPMKPVHVGGARRRESYLRGDAILEAAKQTGAQAIHPGYGFLSENADFADAVEAAGLVFIGPNAASMRKMGSKAGAKNLMQPQRAGGAGLHRRRPGSPRCCNAKPTASATR